jgi:hypothetical protein
MSTEWHFFAFDAESFERHVVAPALGAVERHDAEAWFALLTRLSDVYPVPRLTRYGFNGSSRSITSVDWHTGRGDLLVDTPPIAGSEQLLALFKLAVEALAEFRLVGSCFKPSGVFSELGYPGTLPDASEREEFEQLAATFFQSRRAVPPKYRFVTELNQRAGVAFAPELQSLAAAEARVGLLARLSRDLSGGEWKELASDLAHLHHFLLLGASRGLAMYYREDST